MRILVLRGGAVGDFIVTLPCLRLLRERWPGAHITWVGNARAAALAAGPGGIDEVHAQDAARWVALGQPGRDAALEAWLRRFDLAINFWPDRDGALAAHFAALGVRTVAGSAHPMRAPAAAHFCAALAPLGLATCDYRSRLAVRAGLPVALAPPSGPWLAWHPGSGSPRKNWPLERWAAALREARATRDFGVVVVGGEAERERWPEIRAAAPPGSVETLGATLPELAALFARCAGFLGHDSGLAHLAAAVGTPCLLLFGPTDPAMWAPPGDHVRSLRAGAQLEDLEVEPVAEAITALCSTSG
jgi:heptosyltransferase-3